MASASMPPAWLKPQLINTTKTAGMIEDNMSYDERLFHYTYATRHGEMHFLENRTLQRMNIFRLQNKVASLKGACWTEQKVSEADWDGIKTTLHDYSK